MTAETVRNLPDLGDWDCSDTTLVAEFRLPGFLAAATFASAIAAAADAVDHHPDLSISHPGLVRVVLTTHATGGLTTADVDLARRISTLARTVRRGE